MISTSRRTLFALAAPAVLAAAAVARPEIVQGGFTKRSLDTQIEINAPADHVWSVLTDFTAYPTWNPFIRSASGEIHEGAELAVTVRPPGRDELTFAPTVLVVRPDRELRWRGKLWVRGLFDGEHVFAIEPLGAERVLLHHSEAFSGLLVPLLGSVLRDTEIGFHAMNAALKAQAEERALRRE